MGSPRQDSTTLGIEPRVGLPARSRFLRYAMHRSRYVASLLILGFAVGVAYRHHFSPASERTLPYYLSSGVHGIGIALTAWAVQTGFSGSAQSRFGEFLRRLPVAGEVLIRALVMTTALIVVGVGLQFVIYAGSLGLRWFTADWFTVTVPRIVAIGFGFSLIVGVTTEIGRLIGGPVITSVLLGRYHRPVREERIVMFLDLEGSTHLAEQLGELRVHDLITRFFFDIDEPIVDHGGAVHSYVGDEVIVTWPLTVNPARNARCLSCFFAIEQKMARLTADYRRDFGVVPRFRAGMHAGPVIVSECGDTKRQLAYFGDTMNVAARLREYCKMIDGALVVSGDLLRHIKIPAGIAVGDIENVVLRGRQAPLEAHAIRQASGTGPRA